jgi:quercetin dioxygenase-like cupin family protein
MTDWTQTGEGTQRRIVADGDKMMQVEVKFAAGAVGTLHNHPHEQLTYILSGHVQFTVNGTTREMRAGDVILIPGEAVHGVQALEESVLLDTFSPPREDFRT